MTLGELINRTDDGTIIEVWDEERELFSVSTVYAAGYILTEKWVKAEVDTIEVSDCLGLKVTLEENMFRSCLGCLGMAVLIILILFILII